VHASAARGQIVLAAVEQNAHTKVRAVARNIDLAWISQKAPAGRFLRRPLKPQLPQPQSARPEAALFLAVLIEGPTSTPRCDLFLLGHSESTSVRVRFMRTAVQSGSMIVAATRCQGVIDGCEYGAIPKSGYWENTFEKFVWPIMSGASLLFAHFLSRSPT
jgi:hypothetical protein